MLVLCTTCNDEHYAMTNVFSYEELACMYASKNGLYTAYAAKVTVLKKAIPTSARTGPLVININVDWMPLVTWRPLAFDDASVVTSTGAT